MARNIARILPGMLIWQEALEGVGHPPTALYPLWTRLPVTYSLSGSLSGLFSATATVYARRQMSADLVSTMITTGALRKTGFVEGDFIASLVATASITKIQFMEASLIGEFLGTAELTKATTLSGGLTCNLVTTGALSRTAIISGSLIGNYVATAEITISITPQQIDGEYQIIPGSISYDRLAESLLTTLLSKVKVTSLSPAPDGVETVFSTPSTILSVKGIFRNGSLETSGFSQTGPGEITFSVAPAGSDSLVVFYIETP